jgi:hypothetical protein
MEGRVLDYLFDLGRIGALGEDPDQARLVPCPGQQVGMMVDHLHPRQGRPELWGCSQPVST